MFVRSIIFSVIVLGCVGCVGHNVEYQSPNVHKVQNSIILRQGFDKTWTQLVSGLGKNFFVINNMDKESGFINVSFSGDPELYVDGGVLEFEVSNLAGKRNYKFPATRKYVRYETVGSNGFGDILISCVRTLEMDGRINIILSKVKDDKTQVTVNTRYVLKQNTEMSQVGGGRLPTDNQTIVFNTGEKGYNAGGTTFLSNGKLEKKILSVLTKDLK